MPTPLTFKGDKKSSKSKKRKHPSTDLSPDASLGVTHITSSKAPGPDTASSHPADTAVEEDDTWVSADHASDLAGPIIIVLPSEPLSCVSSDANGTVFAIELENLVEGDPGTAEPHDVRQVWVAQKVAGTGDGLISFKGGSGKYLAVDKFGILSASREAISPEEQFTVVPSPDTPGTFAIQTQRNTFISITPSTTSSKTKPSSAASVATLPEIRGDAESIDFSATFRIRMQARFKPRNKAHKEQKAREKVSRKELEEAVGRRLDEEEVRKLKKARREGNFHEVVLDTRVKGKHDKFASF